MARNSWSRLRALRHSRPAPRSPRCLMNRQYEMNDTVSANAGTPPDQLRWRRHHRPHWRQQQGIWRADLPGQVHLQHLQRSGGTPTPAQIQAYCESSTYLNNIANVAELSAELRDWLLHGQRCALGVVRAGRLPHDQEADGQRRSPLRASDLHRCDIELRSPRRLRL